MKKFPGLIWAVVGATITTMLAVAQLIHNWPDGILNLCLIIFSLLIISIIIAAVTNYGSFKTLKEYEGRIEAAERSKHEVELSKREIEFDKKKAEEVYEKAQRRLARLLSRGLEDTLRRRVVSLTSNASWPPEYEKNLDFYVFAPVGDRHKVIAATVNANAAPRKIALELGSGIVGFAFKNKKAILSNSLRELGTIYDVQFKVVGEQKAIDDSTVEKCDIAVKWVYAIPIYDSKQWSEKVTGVLTVDSRYKEALELFQMDDFRKEVDEIAADIAPYLDVFEEIGHKGKQ